MKKLTEALNQPITYGNALTFLLVWWIILKLL